ncbi:hypothetical protein BI037_gp02 [Morganella phage vB_MmoP_MP2]|uniref:Uncharacterized protein n=1 Tax=Morganella phage vB_MmoP_MP2 TaxID=1852627 RepID=A0A192Y9D5_9CAUD|nr:hypothetical protein BI037_gp02 [Morganella phage vB_MmoP_MP2]ANM46369.1 hypothetical protein MP2_gp02 [Morganella phage vB_MmoP_MP2]QQK88464.1 hypothetical protein [Providencia phage PSTRCR_128]
MELASDAEFMFNRTLVEVHQVFKGERWEVTMGDRYIGDIVELRGLYLTPDCGSFTTWSDALKAMCQKEQRKIDWAMATADLN